MHPADLRGLHGECLTERARQGYTLGQVSLEPDPLTRCARALSDHVEE